MIDTPVITIRRTNNLTPNGSEVLINGIRIDGLQTVEWHVAAGDIDCVVLTFKGKVIVEHFDAPNTERRSVVPQPNPVPR